MSTKLLFFDMFALVVDCIDTFVKYVDFSR